MKRGGNSRSSGDIWICGVNPSLDALRSGALEVREVVLAREDERGREIASEADRRGAPARSATREELTALVGHEHHQGVALRVEEFHYSPLEDLLARPMGERAPLVALDSIQDPQNLGAIIRSSCFLGAKGIVLPRDRSVRVTASVVKVAAGAAAYTPVSDVVNLARSLDVMKQSGLWVVGLDVRAALSIYEADVSVPLVLVVGSEQKGMRPLVRKQCDMLVKIPAHGPVESLNAATACAIALAEVQRQKAAR